MSPDYDYDTEKKQSDAFRATLTAAIPKTAPADYSRAQPKNRIMETLEQQTKDSNMIFTQITSGDFRTLDEAKQALVMFYITDLTISRSGISHALKRLEKHFGARSTRLL